jgi:hypothetical protein
MEQNWNGQIYMSHGTNHSKGVAILRNQGGGSAIQVMYAKL